MVGTILLTQNDIYVKEDGSLPSRPKFDKNLLANLAKSNFVSQVGYDLLPKSIQHLVMVNDNYTYPITIEELNKCRILIVSRSRETAIGKKFRFDNFKLLVKGRKVEIWISIIS